MNRTFITIALAIGIALPFAENAEVRSGPSTTLYGGGTWYVKRDNTRVFKTVRVHDRGRSDGRRVSNMEILQCTLEKGIKVKLLDRTPSGFPVIQTNERPFCQGYVKVQDGIVQFPVPQSNGNSLTSANTTAGIYNQEVFTAGRWADEIPVFKDRGAYYSARFSMDREGHYRNQLGRVACRISVGTAVKFTPFRDWGVGEVETGNCSGWMDRAVVR